MRIYFSCIFFVVIFCFYKPVLAFQQIKAQLPIQQIFSNHDPSKDSEKIVIISKISLKGNIKTKDKIVIRELTFHQNDTLTVLALNNQLEKSRNNLLKTSLFNFVTCTVQNISFDRVEVQITLEERWYIWPNIIFQYADRNFSAWLKHKDINRLNYGLGVMVQNLWGRNEVFKINAEMGYNQMLTLSYYNLYIDKARKHSLWLELSYMRQNQIGYQTIENKINYIKLENTYLIHTREASCAYSYRPQLFNTFILDISYNLCQISDSVALINPDFLGNSRDKIHYYTLLYEFRRDLRDSKAYPLKGYYFYSRFNTIGIERNLSNSIYYFKSSIRKYFEISPRLYAATSITGKISAKTHQPFYFQQALGYRDNIHGYEYYVIDGQHFFMNQNILKFALVPTKILYLKFLPFREFNKIHYSVYLNVYFDNAYVWDNSNRNKIYNNTFANSFLYSEGVGLDFVTYYDRILRFEYSINKQKDKGIFIHFKTPF